MKPALIVQASRVVVFASRTMVGATSFSALVMLHALAWFAISGEAAAQTADDQAVLGPGLYVFQTRTRGASCGDDERTGYVSSFVAPIEGIPGNRVMTMRLINSRYWSTWELDVQADGSVTAESFLDGSSGEDRPANRFSVRREGDRFVGRGTRSYNARIEGVMRRCDVEYDALLRRIDV